MKLPLGKHGKWHFRAPKKNFPDPPRGSRPSFLRIPKQKDHATHLLITSHTRVLTSNINAVNNEKYTQIKKESRSPQFGSVGINVFL